jgi:hypothetical protein
MSEWFDSQKKINSDLQKLLKEHIDKASPRRNLTAVEVKRLAKLEAIADKLKHGENVQNRQLQTWLSEDEYEQLDYEWQEQLELREELNDKPSELKRYEEKIQKATFHANKAEGFRRKGNKQAAESSSALSSRYCEQALEVLQEIVNDDPNLHLWFDRALDFSLGSNIDSQLGNLPRVITSRSAEKRNGDSRAMRKIQVKLNVVENAINSLKYEEKSTKASATDKSKLDDFLKNLE